MPAHAGIQYSTALAIVFLVWIMARKLSPVHPGEVLREEFPGPMLEVAEDGAADLKRIKPLSGRAA